MDIGKHFHAYQFYEEASSLQEEDKSVIWHFSSCHGNTFVVTNSISQPHSIHLFPPKCHFQQLLKRNYGVSANNNSSKNCRKLEKKNKSGHKKIKTVT